ncbi:hypothetical protein CYMTET_48981 [Cymbomonas tetramitiformis]|uniref:Uncharacterized protein n=1 Tax=Cymbomonas tetramitiformis TaxID=36881 RepID=A0AAE0BSD4_9CHLO|nr:hypothetical protein CYMTET_48981 [Cymbomonas tetramitiformis]
MNNDNTPCPICPKKGIVGDCQCNRKSHGELILQRRYLDKLPQGSLQGFAKKVCSSEVNFDPVVKTPTAAAKKTSVDSRFIKLFEHVLRKSKEETLGRPVKTSFHAGYLKIQRANKRDIKQYLQTRDYASDPRRSIHDFPVSCDGDAAFLAWLDADPTSDEPATTVENVQARTYQWSQLEIQAIGNKRGRKVALDAAGEIYNDCVVACRAQLAAGLPGDAHILASIIRAVIECSGHPELLKHFLVSETWTYAFLHANDLKPRKGTNNRKEPANWEAQLEKHVLRVAHVVKTKNIPKALVVAFDHVGFQVLPIKNTTWAPRGSDVVPLIGLDDKRQITAVVAEALDDDGSGIVVGIQLIYTGTTERCLPAVEHRQLEMFADFHFTYTYNHWADEDTNYELFENIIVKHFLNTKTRLRLPPDHPSMVILDCWPVQKSEHFRARVAASWPWIHLEYVPPGCTGKGQKFDVDGGGVYKPKLQERTTRYVQEEFTKALKGGESLENVKLDLTLGTMKTRQLYWIQEVHSEFKSNVLARTKGWNLTGIPRAFTAACQEEAVKVHAEGELWPTGNTLQLVPVGDEMVPEASTDDAEWILNPNSEVDVNSGASTSTVPSCSYEEHGAEIDDARKGKKARTDVEEHFEFSDMNADTYALTLAAGKDEFSFAVKVGSTVHSVMDFVIIVTPDPFKDDFTVVSFTVEAKFF